jgi:sortase A
MRRALRGLSSVLIVTGALLVLDAGVTLLWQEPVTAIYAQLRQDALGGDLGRLERLQPTPQEVKVLEQLGTNPAPRIAFLARSMRRDLHSGQAIGRIGIPRIGASFVVVEGTDSGSLRKGPGHYPATPLPGMPGTVAIAGHRTTYLAPFNELDRLEPGDRIEMEMPYAAVTYLVERSQVVPATALWVTDRKSYNRLVLTACHPKYSAAQRIVVFARQSGEAPRGASARIP